MKHGHGDDAYLLNKKIVADFSSNLWYGGLRPELKSHLAGMLDTIGHYPQVAGEQLQQQMEKHLKLGADNILLTDGATQGIYLIAQAFAGATTTVVGPTYPEYADASRLFGHQVRYLNWDKLDHGIHIDSDIFFICNPNNPGGQVYPGEQLQQLVAANRKHIFVVDEAYIQFTRETTSLIPHLHRLPNLLILRSPTKAACFPGLRFGYIAGQKALLDKVRAYQMPWALNQLALAAGSYLITNPAIFEFPLDNLLADAFQLREKLKAIPELKVYPTYTHYFLFETLTGTAAELKSWLVDKYGILIRDASNIEGLSNGFCRVACRGEKDNKLLVTALKKWALQ